MELVRFYVCITVLIACCARQLACEVSLTHFVRTIFDKKYSLKKFFIKKSSTVCIFQTMHVV